jgi:hypothetical protein
MLGCFGNLAETRAVPRDFCKAISNRGQRRCQESDFYRHFPHCLWCPKTVHKMNSGTETDWVLATQVVGFPGCRTPLIPWRTHFAGAIAKGNTQINRDDAILRLR